MRFRFWWGLVLVICATAADQTPDPPLDSVAPVIQLNRKLPSWVRIDGQYRSRIEQFGNQTFKPVRDTHDLSQLRIKLTITPTDWLQLVGEMQDARVLSNKHIGNVPPYQDTWDIRQAYVQFKYPGEERFDAVVGRQMLSFGEERLVGPSDWLNQGRTFDVARVDLHDGNLGLTLFASSVVVARDGVIDHHIQGNNLHAAYGSMKFSNATIEPYVFWRLAPGKIKLNENAGRGVLNEVTIGARIVGKVPGAFQYDVEMDKQTGSLGPDSISSWAGHWNITKPLDVRSKPHPFVEANYASGTHDPTSRTWSTFDQLYPSSHNKMDFADQVGWKNIVQFRSGVSESPLQNWTFTETYENFWLASARDALYGSSGAPVVQSLNGTAGRHVGQELDLLAVWDWQKIVDVGFGYCRLFTGTFLNHVTPGKDYNYPFFFLAYHFTQVPTN